MRILSIVFFPLLKISVKKLIVIWYVVLQLQRQFLGISLVEMHAMKSASVQCFLTWCKIIQTA